MKKFFALALTLIMVLSLAACGAKEEPAPAPGGDSAVAALPGEGEVYCFIASLNQLEFFDAAKAGVNDAANELGATWYYTGPQQFDPALISEAIDQAAANKVTGIILHGQSDDTAEAIKNAIDAGVPVINIDTDIGTDRLSFLGTGPEGLGRYMGRDMGEALGGKGKVIISGEYNQPSCVTSIETIKEIFATEYPGIEVVAEVDDNADAQTAASVIGAAIQANPDVTGILGMQAPTGVGAATAVREAGLDGKVTIVARDRDQATLDLVKSGEIYSTWAQTSYVQAYTATMWLHQYVNGKLPVVKGYQEYGINPLPAYAEAGMVKVTAENADLFMEKYTYEITAK